MVASEREPVMAVEQYLKALGGNPYGVQTFGGPGQYATTNAMGAPDPSGQVPMTNTATTTPDMPLADLIRYLQGAQGAPQLPAGASDELARAYLAYAGQTQGQSLQQAVQLALQQQTNALRQAELMGADPNGAPTDAAARWRAELQAQQAVQQQRLQQELLQLQGYDLSGNSTVEERQRVAQEAQRWAEITGNAPGGVQTLAAQQQAEEARRRTAELMGYDTSGNQTLAARQMAQQASESAQERQLRLALQAGQLNQQESEFARNYLMQQEQARQRQVELMGYDTSGNLSAEERARRAQEALQAGNLTGYYNGQQTEEQRAAMAREALQQSQLTEQQRAALMQEALAGRRLTEEERAALAREQFQTGQALGSINGQMTEEARAARAREALQAGTALGSINGQQTEEQRAAMAREALQQSQTSGFMGDGDLTEEARAARERERQARAATAADLTRSSRDVFRAANYFRNMQGSNPNGAAAALGLGGGVAGFTTQAQRNMGTPGTIGYGDIDAATGDAGGMGGGFSMASPSTMQAVSVPAVAASGQGGASQGTPAGAANATAWADTSNDRKKREQAVAAGTQPGGPVGMGAGGHFMGRLVSPEQQEQRVQAMREALGHPKVKKMFRQMRDHMADQRPGTGPGGPQGRVPKGRRNSFDGTLEKDRRANRGLAKLREKMEKRMLAALPGSQPGGPVDAPMWPEGGSGSIEQPSVPKAASVGGTPPGAQTMMATTAQPAPFAQADVPQMDQRLASFQEYLRRYGIQGLGPQALEAMNSTDKGIMEGAFEALGLNPEDAYQSYASTRFANTGNPLLA